MDFELMECAGSYLEHSGYELVGDCGGFIVARKGGVLAFVVASSNGAPRPAEYRERFGHESRRFLDENPEYGGLETRCDMFVMKPWKERMLVRYYENVGGAA